MWEKVLNQGLNHVLLFRGSFEGQRLGRINFIDVLDDQFCSLLTSVVFSDYSGCLLFTTCSF